MSEQQVTDCVCDNCHYLNKTSRITVCDKNGKHNYYYCWCECYYVRLDWSCVNWKRKKKV